MGILIPCEQIAKKIEKELKQEVEEYSKNGKTITLETILVGSEPDQLSFVAIKREMAKKLGINFIFNNIKNPPMYEAFANIVRQEALKKEITGIIVQQPLPSSIDAKSVYSTIPLIKEIESHTDKSKFIPPLGRTILTALKYIVNKNYDDPIVTEKDFKPIQQFTKKKNIVLMGMGVTGGKPIAKTLLKLGVNMICISSKTPISQVESFLKEADIVITATGHEVVKRDMVKNDVILLNVGLRKSDGKLIGDYNEEEISLTASYYTKTPRGLGPIDVLYLYKNLLDSARIQYGEA